MEINLDAFQQDSEADKKSAQRKKIQKLSIVLVLAVLARIFIKNPAPPQAPVYTNQDFRALPGVYRNLTEDQKKKFTPEQLAMLQEADKKVEVKTKPGAVNLLEHKKEDATPKGKETFAYEHKKPEVQKWVAPGNTVEPDEKSERSTLVQFRHGGALKVESVTRDKYTVTIRVNSAMRVKFPASIVTRILENAENWEEPLLEGYLGNQNAQ